MSVNLQRATLNSWTHLCQFSDIDSRKRFTTGIPITTN